MFCLCKKLLLLLQNNSLSHGLIQKTWETSAYDAIFYEHFSKIIGTPLPKKEQQDRDNH